MCVTPIDEHQRSASCRFRIQTFSFVHDHEGLNGVHIGVRDQESGMTRRAKRQRQNDVRGQGENGVAIKGNDMV